MFSGAAFEAYKLPTAAPRAGGQFAAAPRRFAAPPAAYRYAADAQTLYFPQSVQSVHTLPPLTSPSLKTRLEPRAGGAPLFRSQDPLSAFGPKTSLYKELTAKYGLVLKPRAPNSLPRLSVTGRPEEFKPYQPAGARRGDLLSGLRNSSPESAQTESGWARSEPPSSTVRSALLYAPRRWQPAGLSLPSDAHRAPSHVEVKFSAPEPLRRIPAQRAEYIERIIRGPTQQKLEAAELLSTQSGTSTQPLTCAAPRVADGSTEPLRPFCAPRRALAETLAKVQPLPDERQTASTLEQRGKDSAPAKASTAEAAPQPPIFSSQRFIPFRAPAPGAERPAHGRSRSFARETPERASAPRKGDSGPESRQEVPESDAQTPALNGRQSPAESESSSAPIEPGSEQAQSIPPSLLVEQSGSCGVEDLSFAEMPEAGALSALRGDQRAVAALNSDGGYYVGETSGGHMDGLGRLYDARGHLVYEGYFSANHFEGMGTLSLQGVQAAGGGQPWHDLTARADALLKYQGEFCESRFNGQGVAEYIGGEIFFGEFKNGLPEGYGIWTNDEQTVCGVWAAGVLLDGA